MANLPGIVLPGEIVMLTAHEDEMVDKDINPAGMAFPRPKIPVVDPKWKIISGAGRRR